MTDPSTAEAITALAPLTRKVTAGGKEYTVVPLETRQLFPILRSILPIIDGLAALIPKDSSVAGEPTLGAGPGTKPQAAGELSGLKSLLGSELVIGIRTMAEHGERINEMIACAMDQKVSTVGQWKPQETFAALRAVLEVNRDFFMQEVLPLLGISGWEQSDVVVAVKEAWKSAKLGVGETPSST